jgi:hypothetical protein
MNTIDNDYHRDSLLLRSIPIESDSHLGRFRSGSDPMFCPAHNALTRSSDFSQNFRYTAPGLISAPIFVPTQYRSIVSG